MYLLAFLHLNVHFYLFVLLQLILLFLNATAHYHSSTWLQVVGTSGRRPRQSLPRWFTTRQPINPPWRKYCHEQELNRKAWLSFFPDGQMTFTVKKKHLYHQCSGFFTIEFRMILIPAVTWKGRVLWRHEDCSSFIVHHLLDVPLLQPLLYENWSELVKSEVQTRYGAKIRAVDVSYAFFLVRLQYVRWCLVLCVGVNSPVSNDVHERISSKMATCGQRHGKHKSMDIEQANISIKCKLKKTKTEARHEKCVELTDLTLQ